MRRLLLFVAVIVIICLGGITQAGDIATVLVDDARNAMDTRYTLPNGMHSGSVDYNYNIGKYEVTSGQYTEFLNATAKADLYGLYNTKMWSTPYSGMIRQLGVWGSFSYTVQYADRPVNWVSYWDACRFTNWLATGNTEIGTYNLAGYTGNDGRNIQRNENWVWAVTSDDEWYKAAYYKSGGTNAGYWNYPTQTNDRGEDYERSNLGGVGHTTDVGSYGYASAYGTFDQGGNVQEWTEGIVYYYDPNTSHGNRGGAFDGGYSDPNWLPNNDPNYESSNLGFRVVQSVPQPVPEASSLLGACIMLLPVGLRELKNRLRK